MPKLYRKNSFNNNRSTLLPILQQLTLLMKVFVIYFNDNLTQTNFIGKSEDSNSNNERKIESSGGHGMAAAVPQVPLSQPPMFGQTHRFMAPPFMHGMPHTG
jgi:hypothetical protein